MSSTSSGGEHDSTGLRAERKLNTPLSRCASLEKHTRSLRRFRGDTANWQNGEPSGSPFLLETALTAAKSCEDGGDGAMMRGLCDHDDDETRFDEGVNGFAARAALRESSAPERQESGARRTVEEA